MYIPVLSAKIIHIHALINLTSQFKEYYVILQYSHLIAQFVIEHMIKTVVLTEIVN